MDALARIAIYPDVQKHPERMQRALDVIDLVSEHLHIGPPPRPDENGIVTFLQLKPDELVEGLAAVAPGWQEEALFFFPIRPQPQDG